MNSFLAIHKLITAYRNGRCLALLLDYEGTLVPAESATPGALGWSTRSLLTRLAHLPRTATGVIGDCELAQLKQGVGVDDIYYAGWQGLEVDLRHGKTWSSETLELRKELPRLRAFIEDLLSQFPSVRVRQQQRGLTIDYGDCPEGALAEAEVLRVLLTCQPELRIFKGRNSIEVGITELPRVCRRLQILRGLESWTNQPDIHRKYKNARCAWC